MVDELRRDPSTGRLIDAIRDLVASVPADPPPPTSCPRPVSPVHAQLEALNGTYVTTVTEKQLQDAGEHQAGKAERELRGTHICARRWPVDPPPGRESPTSPGPRSLVDTPTATEVFTFDPGAGPDDWTKARLEIDPRRHPVP